MEAIVDMTEPNNKEKLATFMGMITYLGKFVQNLSAVSVPLRDQTQKGVAWSWGAHHQEVFSELKQAHCKRTYINSISPGRFNTFSTWGADSAPPP